VVTYQDLTHQPELTALEQGRLFIITIDDISLQAPINASIQEMIALLQEAGYPAVLGVVTEGLAANTETAIRLKQLADLGWEIAAHTDTHPNLAEIERASAGDVYREIQTCADKLSQHVGVRPITLVLPYGQMVNNAAWIKKAQITWIVGIVGGETYDATGQLFYVGREGPYIDAALTLQVMIRRFNP
jgi:peptidoglycan/xylan/chitin deacetylase (PgdA/CDA1 family)